MTEAYHRRNTRQAAIFFCERQRPGIAGRHESVTTLEPVDVAFWTPETTHGPAIPWAALFADFCLRSMTPWILACGRLAMFGAEFILLEYSRFRRPVAITRFGKSPVAACRASGGEIG